MPVYNWRDHKNPPPGPAVVLDADTGERLHKVWLVDTDQDLVGRYVLDEKGLHVLLPDRSDVLTRIEHRRVRLLWINQQE